MKGRKIPLWQREGAPSRLTIFKRRRLSERSMDKEEVSKRSDGEKKNRQQDFQSCEEVGEGTWGMTS